MNLRGLRVPALLILAFSIPCHGQSLGDVARQIRAERQAKGTSHPTVITNDDIESTEPASAVSPNAFQDASQNATKDAGAENAQAPSPAADLSKSANGANDSAKERELEIQQRSDEINKVYLDRIAALRTQIDTAQTELARLQRDQVESTNDFKRTAGASPNIATYEEQQRLFNEQIEAQHNLIDSLRSQLEDAREAARHAGVPHAYD
jgi:chromosome segregation ATPase